MKIYLDGPDSGGKTHLAKVLQEALKCEYIHYSYNEDDFEYADQIKQSFEFLKEHDNVIIDRHLISEYVYGSVVRNEPRIHFCPELDGGKDFINDLLNAFDLIIFCLPMDKGIYLKNYVNCMKTKEEYISNVDIMSKIYDKYQDIYLTFKSCHPDLQYKVVRYDYLKTL